MSSIQGQVTASRRALEAFLSRYPLCYGYWKKYTDLERRAGDNDKAEEVRKLNPSCLFAIVNWYVLKGCALFQVCVRGLKIIPLSVDLWIHYINLLLGTLDMKLPESQLKIRRYEGDSQHDNTNTNKGFF